MAVPKAHLEQILENYNSTYVTEQQFIHQIRAFVNEVDHPCSRETLSGHITASAWVVSSDWKYALLIHHNKLDRWFQPGGHIEESDPSIIAASQREALEETGLLTIQSLSTEIFDIDIHTIPERKGVPEHLHYDIRYLFSAEQKALSPDLAEVHDARWVEINKQFEAQGADSSLQRMFQKTLELQKTVNNATK